MEDIHDTLYENLVDARATLLKKQEITATEVQLLGNICRVLDLIEKLWKERRDTNAN